MSGQTNVKARTRGPSLEKTAETRSKIINAALTVFIEKGYANTSVADIAGSAGIAKGTPYRYFPTKEQLFEGILEDVVVAAVADIYNRSPSDDETVEVFLRRLVLPFMRDFETSGRAAIARLVISDGAGFPTLVNTYRTKVYEPIIDLIKRCAATAIERGELKNRALADCPYLLVAPLWIGIVHNAVLNPGNRLDMGAMFETQLDLIFNS
ncbi:TetR/AcrR family transcriptional regulator [Rhizobium sp. 2YAF20]|uniref:TetR/AcrR family transcriptional regulator n=1 Tax=Rhizobium sp. 2YAF20 TaxID=3233027 RepID=UPI003F967629